MSPNPTRYIEALYQVTADPQDLYLDPETRRIRVSMLYSGRMHLF